MASTTQNKKKNTTKKRTPTSRGKNSTKTGKRVTAAEKKRIAALEEKKAKREKVAVVLFAVAVFIFFVTVIKGANVWYLMHSFVLGVFGVCAVVWALLLVYFSARTGLDKPDSKLASHFLFCLGFLTIINACIFLFFDGPSVDTEQLSTQFGEILVAAFERGAGNAGGGMLGALAGGVLLRLFGLIGSQITVILVAFVFLMLMTKTKLSQLFAAVSKPASRVKNIAQEKTSQIKENVTRKNGEKTDAEDIDQIFNVKGPDYERSERAFAEDPLLDAEKQFEESINMNSSVKTAKRKKTKREEIPVFDPMAVMKAGENGIQEEQIKEKSAVQPKTEGLERLVQKAAERKFVERTDEQVFAQEVAREREQELRKTETYTFPPVDLLKYGEESVQENVAAELKANGELLVKTLQDFHIATKIVDISRGPAITRYELQPAPGVKISRITGLSDDIAMNLAAPGVRIEAPIPGKSAVGIEIPNKIVSIVKTRAIIDSDEFKKSKSKITITLGKDISGAISLADIAKMPHLLIAGSTGSGKSVCINSIIMSILYKASPEEVKLLMVDPKVVELGIYNGIPHLIVPVVTDPKKAASALAWAVSEMLKRYELFAENNVRDLNGYNRLSESKDEIEKLPQIVIIIDELADLMMVAKKEVEDYIGRLTQMARAAGMHLIVATQRPSVDVITGVIKANIPSRIAFAVSSQVDSRTIIDGGGAEKLIGRGDMLFMPVGSNKPKRIQGCFVSDSEIEKVVDFIKSSSESNYDENVASEIEAKTLESSEEETESAGNSASSDPMFEKAAECVIEAGQASTSLLQRKLRLGYARAGRLIDELEQAGVVGPYEGSKPRQVLMTGAQWMERKMNLHD